MHLGPEAPERDVCKGTMSLFVPLVILLLPGGSGLGSGRPPPGGEPSPVPAAPGGWGLHSGPPSALQSILQLQEAGAAARLVWSEVHCPGDKHLSPPPQRVFSWSYFLLSLLKKILATLMGVLDPSSPTGDQTHAPCMVARNFNHWTAREVPPGLTFTLPLAYFPHRLKSCVNR